MIHEFGCHNVNMHNIFKSRKGKDFYRDQLEYMEYNPDMFDDQYVLDEHDISTEEIAHKIVGKLT